MVYGKYGRVAVYAFQELFRRIGLGQLPEDVAIVRETIGAIRPGHYLHPYLRRADDLRENAGLVDTFLHARDRPYVVADCLALAEDAGLVFQGWDENAHYYPDASILGTPLFRQRMDALPERQVWEAMELATGVLSMHYFHACRPERDAASYRIPLESEAILNCVPVRFANVVPATQAGAPGWALMRKPMPPVSIENWQAALFSAFDGQHTLSQCIEAARLRGNVDVIASRSRQFCKLLWRVGYAQFRLPSAKQERSQ